MKKSLIALAIAGVFVAPVAMAEHGEQSVTATGEVVIYGQANVAFDVVNSSNGTTTKNGATATPASVNANQVSSNASRIGFKGSEDLGGGLSAIYQIETLVNIDNSTSAATPTNGFATRNTFAGLSSSSMGTLVLGRHDTPYKLATRHQDLFADTIADNRSLMGGVTFNALTGAGSAAASFDGRQTDVVAYISPAMSGFTAAVAYVAGAENPVPANPSPTKGSAWSLAGMYNAGALNGSLAYEVHDLGTVGSGTLGALPLGAPSQKETAWKLGVGYTMDQFAVNAVYEKTNDNFGGATGLAGVGTAGGDFFGHSAYYLSGKYNVTASDAVKLAYTHSGDINGANLAAAKLNTAAHQVSLGYDHSLSKRTTVYALYTKLTNNAGAAYALGNADAGSGGIAANGFNSSPSAFGLGMKHAF
ncbi:MAG: porin [Betaproteobacteria bacterium]|nr:porin [Betaproteobacteria bacterium]